MSNLEFLRDILPGCSDEDADEMLAAVDESLDGAKRISEIVASMKRVAHSGTLERTAVDINKIVADTATICRNEWKYHAELTLDLEDSLPRLVCMPGDIGQLFLNLIVNAAHAVAERFGAETKKGEILVKTRSREDGIVFSVQDNGSGIPDAIKNKIFNLFFSTKPAGKGSGQGLSIANSVVERHGGSIEFDSTLGVGTEFRVFLPFDPPEKA
jgi:signal transduction histidine kinase